MKPHSNRTTTTAPTTTVNAAAAEQIYDEILSKIIIEVACNVHRAAKTGVLSYSSIMMGSSSTTPTPNTNTHVDVKNDGTVAVVALEEDSDALLVKEKEDGRPNMMNDVVVRSDVVGNNVLPTTDNSKVNNSTKAKTTQNNGGNLQKKEGNTIPTKEVVTEAKAGPESWKGGAALLNDNQNQPTKNNREGISTPTSGGNVNKMGNATQDISKKRKTTLQFGSNNDVVGVTTTTSTTDTVGNNSSESSNRNIGAILPPPEYNKQQQQQQQQQCTLPPSISNSTNAVVVSPTSVPKATNNNTDIYGRTPGRDAKYLIPCPSGNCNRMITSSRMAMHLEKCLGLSSSSSTSTSSTTRRGSGSGGRKGNNAGSGSANNNAGGSNNNSTFGKEKGNTGGGGGKGSGKGSGKVGKHAKRKSSKML